MLEAFSFFQAPSGLSWVLTEALFRNGPWVVSGLCILFAIFSRIKFDNFRNLVFCYWLFILNLITTVIGLYVLLSWLRSDIMTGHITIEPILEGWNFDWLMSLPNWATLCLLYFIGSWSSNKTAIKIQSRFKNSLFLLLIGALLTWISASFIYASFNLDYWKTYSFVVHFYENWYLYWLPFFFSIACVIFLFVISMFRLVPKVHLRNAV